MKTKEFKTENTSLILEQNFKEISVGFGLQINKSRLSIAIGLIFWFVWLRADFKK